MQGSEDLSAYSVLPVCRIKEKHPDGSLILDEEFIPTCTTLHASVQLKDFMDEVEGTLVERARLLAKRIGSPGQQGIADVAEFMMLQVFNRMQPSSPICLIRRCCTHRIFIATWCKPAVSCAPLPTNHVWQAASSFITMTT